MKQLIRPQILRYALLLFLSTVANAMVWAQDNTTTTATNTATSTTEQQTWYAEPWVWVVGGAVLILLIVALTRGSSNAGRTDKVTFTKTTSSETE